MIDDLSSTVPIKGHVILVNPTNNYVEEDLWLVCKGKVEHISAVCLPVCLFVCLSVRERYIYI